MKRNPDAVRFADGEVTIFAPTDEAMSKYRGPRGTQFILNHMVNVNVRMSDSTTYSQMTRLSSLAPGSPPLYISKKSDDYYVNGAKIIMHNLETQSADGRKKQRLHIVDRVLEPVQDKDAGTDQEGGDSGIYVGLTAGKLLRKHREFSLGRGNEVGRFAGQVRAMGMTNVFDRPGQNTFFIPVDSAFDALSPRMVDKEVIPAHVVPNRLMLSRPIVLDVEQHTATYDNTDGIKVAAVIRPGRTGPTVRSRTMKGSLENPRGEEVSSLIVKANIPVANGVVHLIEKPLVIVATTLWDYIQNAKRGTRFSKFARLLERHGGQLKDLIVNVQDGTVFAPSDNAFTSVAEAALDDPTVAARVLGLHFVEKRIAGDDVRVHRPQNGLAMYDARVSYPKKADQRIWLYFKDDNSTLMVDGRGTAAEVIEADIGATNGVIHVIDKILGLPSETVYEKMSHDPMLSSAFSLGTQTHFNEALNDTNTKFTYLVPSNRAWEKIGEEYASVHKQLFLGTFGYQVRYLNLSVFH